MSSTARADGAGGVGGASRFRTDGTASSENRDWLIEAGAVRDDWRIGSDFDLRRTRKPAVLTLPNLLNIAEGRVVF